MSTDDDVVGLGNCSSVDSDHSFDPLVLNSIRSYRTFMTTSSQLHAPLNHFSFTQDIRKFDLVILKDNRWKGLLVNLEIDVCNNNP